MNIQHRRSNVKRRSRKGDPDVDARCSAFEVGRSSNGAALPYLGAAYYPEAWPAEDVAAEIPLMLEAGLNVVRMGEFAWSSMEPTEGKYDFGWLHTAVDKLGKAGIRTIMCTPTCTPPAWLTERHPEVLRVDDSGRRTSHGARGHFCPNHRTYRHRCTGIVTRLAREFGRDDNVIGWQIDNELSPQGDRGCCCPVCHRKFQDRMRAEFGTIANLNRTWGTSLWSQTYQSFRQLPIPSAAEWHHPSLILAWMRAASSSITEYAEHQSAILHRHVRQPVGTDMVGGLGVSYPNTNRTLDVVQHNHYQMDDNLWEAAFWCDLCRPLKQTPFWITETATCWFGGVRARNLRPPGFCRANSWLPVALGAEANLYWLWRAHWSGQELMHGAVVSSCLRPLHVFDEIKDVAAGYRNASRFINGTRPVSGGMALHASTDAFWFFSCQSIAKGFDYRKTLAECFYRPLIHSQRRLDVIDPCAALEAYQVVLSPFVPMLDECGLRERIKSWIEAGGTWIVGPLSDVRTRHGTKFTHAPYGSLEEWAGIRCKYEIPGDHEDASLRWADGTRSKGSAWYDAFEMEGAEALASYTEGPMSGLTAVARREFGQGEIIVLGTILQASDIVKLVSKIGKGADIRPVASASENLLVVPREGEAGRGLMVVEHENRPGWIRLPAPATDLITGRRCSGRVRVEPFGVRVLIYGEKQQLKRDGIAGGKIAS